MKNIDYDKIIFDEDYIVIPLSKYKLFMSIDNGVDAQTLYLHLIFTGKTQGTNQVWACDNYLKNGLKWGKDRLRSAKKTLVQLGLIEYIKQERDEKGLFLGKRYIKVITNSPLSRTYIGQTDNRIDGERSDGYSPEMLKGTTEMLKGTTETIINNSIDVSTKHIDYFKDNDFIEIVKTWNSFKTPASKHSLDKHTKTLESSYNLYQSLKKGTFLKQCTNITQEWLDKNEIDIPLDKKWTHEEILSVIIDCGLQFESGYWPFYLEDKKRFIPRSLDKTFYNSRSKGCFSTFLKVFAKKPKKIDIEDPIDKKILDKYIEFLFNPNMDEKEYNDLVKAVNSVIREREYIIKSDGGIYQSYCYTEFDSEVKKSFHENYIKYLKTWKNIVPNSIKAHGNLYTNFCNWMYNKYKVVMYPSKEKLKQLKRSYDISIERHNSKYGGSKYHNVNVYELI